MPKLNFKVPHSQSSEDARHRLEHFTDGLKSKFQGQMSDFSESWNDNCLSFGFKTFGIRIAGEIAINDTDLDVCCELPLTAMMFKGKIESEVQQQLGRLMR
ncbi:MAG: polyhydroxyalkanoic acid system family protein [Pirellulales bacterium]